MSTYRRALTQSQAKRCEEAHSKRCRCRCRGALHGSSHHRYRELEVERLQEAQQLDTLDVASLLAAVGGEVRAPVQPPLGAVELYGGVRDGTGTGG